MMQTMLAQIVADEYRSLMLVSESDAAEKRPTGGWTRKQELGHLIDSAANNHNRIVRAALDGEYSGPGYEQDRWVDLHGYAGLPWLRIVNFWRDYNLLLADVIERVSIEALVSACMISGAPPVTLGYLIEDYIVHMRHHVDHVLDRKQITPYPQLPPR
ncbi:MAG: DinB family protein [Acidobacteriota bacterium]|nr:DinB family protein [Acidobacteriota bacterium]